MIFFKLPQYFAVFSIGVKILGVIDVVQTEIHTAELLLLEHHAFEVKNATGVSNNQVSIKFKRNFCNQKYVLRSINVLLLSGVRENESFRNFSVSPSECQAISVKP